MNNIDGWPAFRVERRAVSSLKPYKNNARTHSAEQIEQIAASIREWGWTQPVLVDEKGGVIAGHGRLLAAQSLGVAEVPVIVARGWSKAQRQAYVLADNQLALNADWDRDLLKVELGALGEMGFDTSLLGFGDDFLADVMADRSEGLTDPDDAPAAPVNPVTRLGDVWLLGRHRVLCGDSTKAEDVAALARDERADLCFTSPPYGQQRDYGVGKVTDWDELMRGVFAALPTKPAAQVLVNLGMIHRDGEWLPYWDGWIEWMRSQGWRRFGWYVWDQGFGLPGDWNGRLAPSHEFIFHFNRVAERARKTMGKKPENVQAKRDVTSTMRGKDGKTRRFSSPGASAQSNKVPDSVIRVNRQVGRIADNLDHPAVFPVNLPCGIIEAFSDPGDAVYDPFLGSGTTFVAAETTGRVGLGMEIDPAYVDVIVKRWQAFTGKAATLDGDGRSFEEIENERREAAK